MYLNGVSPVTVSLDNQGNALYDKVLDIGKGLLALKQQRDIQSINLDRLRQGLPPIEASDVAVGAKVAVDNAQLNKVLVVVAASVAVLALVSILRRK